MEPLYGMIYCWIKQEKLDDADEQINLVSEVSSNKTAIHYFLDAMIKRKKGASQDIIIKLLD